MNVLRPLRYGLVGLGNTAVHWIVFLLLHRVLDQALSNFLAFTVAATCSYCLNARFTFAATPSKRRYLLFVLGMGALSLLLGALADRARLSPWLTLVSFSLVSLVVGYSYSRRVVFKGRTP